MQVFRSLEALKQTCPNLQSACALGMFDGVHVGHQMVCQKAIRQAKIKGLSSLVFSFANHPQSLLSQTPTDLLSTLEERLELFKTLGFDIAVILDFNDAFKQITATHFVQDILVDAFKAHFISAGYDYCFGQHREGDGSYLKQASQQYGFSVEIIDPVRVNEQIVSSTVIRKLLKHGQVEEANQYLGRLYSLKGEVIQGHQRGQSIGFPTANIDVADERVVPATGTYGGLAILKGVTYRAVCNIGLSPTFGDILKKRVEVHLIGYNGKNFYGSTLEFQVSEKIRDEQKFNSVDELIAQIEKDCEFISAHELSELGYRY